MTNQENNMRVDRQIEKLTNRIEQLELENSQLRKIHASEDNSLSDLSRLSSKFDAILHSCPDHIFICNPIGEFTHVGLSAAQAHGLAPHEMLGKSWRDLGIPTDIADKLENLRLDVIAKGRSVSGKTELPSIDGLKMFEYVLMPLHAEESGDIYSVLCVATDITDRIRIGELEYLFESILKNIRDAAFVLDAKSSQIVLFNERACEIYGYTENEFSGKPFIELSSIIRGLGEWGSFISELQENPILVFEGNECQRNGNIFPVEISISYVGEKGLDYIIAFIRDISDLRHIRKLESQIKQGLEDTIDEQTAGLRKINNLLRHEIIERQKTEQALRDKEEQLQTIINIIPHLIAYIDKDRCYQFNNKEYERCFNQSIDNIVGKPVEEVIGDKRYGVIKDYITDALLGNEVIFEEQILCEAAGNRWMRGHYYPDIDKTGQVSGFISLVSDISQEKEIQEEEKTQLAEHFHLARLGTIGEMVTEIAHELNQPLCAMTNYSEAGLRMLELGTGSTQDISEALAEISVQSNRAGKIIERLRSFARRREPKYEQLDINAVAGEAIHIAQMDSMRDSIKLIFEINKDRPIINADNLLIQQVILNLIRNARDAINSLPAPSGKVKISSEKLSEEYVKIMVSDTAGLLPGDDLERIFQPFYSTKNDGLGMGLAISNTIVELHGGKMWAESNRNNETVVQFTLPITTRADSYNDA